MLRSFRAQVISTLQRCAAGFTSLLLVAACSTGASIGANGETLFGEQLSDGVTVFKGVPFAEPPLGALRWALPQPLSAKQEQRDARKFAPACMQTMRILEWYRQLAETFGASPDVFADLETSEDCLYLNVWTPDLDAGAKLPVMVYIHGGSNNSGWSYEPNYHGHALAARGVVVVSIAYRLGVFGFFAHPDTRHANFGLWDQLAALQWIQEHIASFGGDPQRVTVFGESAGAQDALALMASAKSAGLMHAAVLQSNAGFGIGATSSPTLEEEQQRGLATARLFGFDGPGSLARLRDLPADELLRRYEQRPDYSYHAPVVDGQLLQKAIWSTIVDGELPPLPLIIGTNADESYDSAPVDATAQDVAAWVEQKTFLNSAAVLQAVAGESDPREAIDRINSAESMQCPSQLLAARQTAAHGNGWLYFFSRVREGEAGAKVRAYHGAELPYVFGTHNPWMSTTGVDRALSEQMIGYWTNLAHHGDPNGGELPPWPPFTGPNGRVMEFGDEVATTRPQEPLLCRLFGEAVAPGD